MAGKKSMIMEPQKIFLFCDGMEPLKMVLPQQRIQILLGLKQTKLHALKDHRISLGYSLKILMFQTPRKM